MAEPLLECSEVTKSFAAVRAVRAARLNVEAGTIHGLVGHNGAGKSTLTRIIAGLVGADSGTIRIDGEALPAGDRRAAIAHGILNVPQELTILPGLRIEENICVGNEPRGVGGFLSRRKMRRRASEALAMLDAEDLMGGTVEDLAASQQRVVMIATALSRPCRLLILDEPTASLGHETAEPLMKLIEGLPSRGITVLYISHRLDEVVRLCDRISVMRDGLVTADIERGKIDAAGLVVEMLGEPEEPEPVVAARVERAPEEGLAARLVGVGTKTLRDFNLELPRGQIVGLTGLVGSGVDEAIAVIAGVQRPEVGTVEVGGEEAVFHSPADALDRGIGFVAGSRARAGLRDLAVRENVLISSLSRSARAGFTSRAADRRRARGFVDRLGLGGRLDDPLGDLSGGNQQKAIVARLLAADARILVLDDPTAGVDAGARAELHSILRRVAAEGRVVVVRSSEPEELVDLADEVHVVTGGRLAASFAGDRLRAAALVAASASSGRGEAGGISGSVS